MVGLSFIAFPSYVNGSAVVAKYSLERSDDAAKNFGKGAESMNFELESVSRLRRLAAQALT